MKIPRDWYTPDHPDPIRHRTFGLNYRDVRVCDCDSPLSYLYKPTLYHSRRTVDPVRVVGRVYRTSINTYDMIALVEYDRCIKTTGPKYFEIGRSRPSVWTKNADINWFFRMTNSVHYDDPFINEDYNVVEGESVIIDWHRTRIARTEMPPQLNIPDHSQDSMLIPVRENYWTINIDLSANSRVSEANVRPLGSDNYNSEPRKPNLSTSHDDIKNINTLDITIKKDSSIIRVNDDPFELPQTTADKGGQKSRDNISLVHRGGFRLSPAVADCLRSGKLHRIIFGPEGVGKTSLAKYAFNNEGLVVEIMEDLISYNPKIHRGIIFENIDFCDTHHWTISELIETEERIVKTNKGEVTLPANVRFIFTTSIDRGKIFGVGPELRPLYRQFHLLYVNVKCYIETNDDESEIIHTAFPGEE